MSAIADTSLMSPIADSHERHQIPWGCCGENWTEFRIAEGRNDRSCSKCSKLPKIGGH